MGDTVRGRKGANIQVRYECVDSLGLQQVRIIVDGKVVKELWSRDRARSGSEAGNPTCGSSALPGTTARPLPTPSVSERPSLIDS